MENVLFSKYGIVADSGKVIFREGQMGNRMFIIQEGSVRITKLIGGKEHILAVLNKGDFFGEMAIVNRLARSATATAAGTVKLLTFNRQEFLGMIEKNAGIALNIIDKLCKRLQQTNLQVQHLVRKNEQGLVILNMYYAFSEAGFEEAILDYHKLIRDLSLNLEIPQETIIRYIHNLLNMGILRLDENNLYLNNRDLLNRAAETAGQG